MLTTSKLSCASLSDLIPFQTAAYTHARTHAPEEPSEDGGTPQRAVVFHRTHTQDLSYQRVDRLIYATWEMLTVP